MNQAAFVDSAMAQIKESAEQEWAKVEVPALPAEMVDALKSVFLTGYKLGASAMLACAMTAYAKEKG